MSDLQLALLALGALIIVIVVLFNWWQEKKFHSEASERFEEPKHDALMDDFQMDSDAILKDESIESNPQASEVKEFNFHEDTDKIEESTLINVQDVPQENLPQEDFSEPPELSEEHIPDNSFEGIAQTQQPPNESITQEAESLYTMPQEPISLPADIHQQIDLVALLYLANPASGADLRELLQSLAVDKPVYLYGLDLDNVWHLLTREEEEREFIKAVCSLQLADRSGPVSRESLNRFLHAVDTLGLKLGAHVEWQGGADPLVYANELDQFCIDVDKMVGFHLAQGTSGSFTGTKLRGLAEASGLVLHGDGAFHYEADNGHQQFSLINQDNYPFSIEMLRTAVIRGVTFQLDIPRVKNSPEVFNHMVQIARQMESSLGANLVDDNQRVLSDTLIEKIRQQLKIIHAKMVTRGIVPGSSAALRLFS